MQVKQAKSDEKNDVNEMLLERTRSQQCCSTTRRGAPRGKVLQKESVDLNSKAGAVKLPEAQDNT